ncbi:electron transfer flavoprotein subunit alpha/FixB family protein [Desulfosporosinus fructosivorans]|uniref:Electron transfer flavoprotein subunit alpha/FixB family protein n=1 Tax=Desulfosporosinus fructosivorans TaxID=2018669 RepID=A0A4Z0R3F9_9FIRM|nr:electron transfer flavoprotein subunit alpha/FixB family protein [Desulfosporosinus fructosivorans]TGE37019.1 electron transfer flavoprotein subunit alpha/FixB family protein [Desulfosporosinus fructosivorans]
MAGIYVFSDKLDIAAEIISFAKQTGKEVFALTFTEEAAAELAQHGSNKVYLLKGVSPIVENYSKSIAEFITKEGAELFVVGATARGRDIAARVAGYLDCGMVSDVSSLSYTDGILVCERMLYGGAVVQSEVLTGLSVVTVPAGKFEVCEGKSEIVTVNLEADTRVSLVARTPIIKGGVELNGADKIVCVGLGLDKEEDLQMARELATVLDAELGCSRGIAEERQWLPVEQYIGISGAVIQPQLYLSMGVSGQIQHMFGIRDSKIIVAIDSNEKAPIFRSADYGIVGDMYEIIPLLTETLRNM